MLILLSSFTELSRHSLNSIAGKLKGLHSKRFGSYAVLRIGKFF